MTACLSRQFPTPCAEQELRGLYLSLDLHKLGTPGLPFVYANFLSSLDGRIALDDPDSGQSFLPRELTSPEDFRLFLELQAQADCLITHGGYMRSLEQGRLGNILQVGLREEHGDLRQWRRQQGLSPQPAVVVVSSSLDFRLPVSLREHGQNCLLVTGARAPEARVAQWREAGYEVIRCSHAPLVSGDSLVSLLEERGFRSLYLIAGPLMLETMLRHGRLSRLFVTIRHQLLGGLPFHSLIPGAELSAAGYLRLLSLYYHQPKDARPGQWFAQFDAHAESRNP
jgi:riboflavin biosynthesis pyrimidine reductase